MNKQPKSWSLLGAVLGILLAGCACNQAEPGPANPAPPPSGTPLATPAPSATTPVPSATTPPPVPGGGGLYGTWKSPSCGARGYERRIYFETDGTFQSEDLVSPCPPGTVCVWSGIVVTHGTFVVSGGTVTLTPKSGGGGPKPGASELPKSLTWDAQGALSETAANGAVCAYKR
jgi:hypothetical protein